MKLLTIAVPCYNSAAYMEKCVQSLLPGGFEVEILIIDDGSQKDNTAQIADKLEYEYPGIVKAIHQANAGHGGAVSTGIQHATGLYFKVVDSDDCLDEKAYKEILDVLREMRDSGSPVDMVLSNFIYDKEGQKHKKVMQYKRVLPEDRIFTWQEIGYFLPGKYILMHSIIYRTKILQKMNFKLPKHTFYVDNIYAFTPFQNVKTLYYKDVNLYKYYIGREDQSVNESIMISRIDQQLKVNRIMIDDYTSIKFKSRKLAQYMRRYLEIITVISSVLAIRSGTEENLKKKDEIWVYMKEKNPRLYRQIRYGIVGLAVNLPGKYGRKIVSKVYELAQKIYGFN